MTVQENIAIARKWNLRVISEQKIGELDEVLHPQYQNRSGTDGPWSKSWDREEARRIGTSGDFPSDFKITIDDIFGEGDKVAVRLTFWRGDKPTSNVIAIYRFENGKIIDDWACVVDLK